MKTNNKAKPEPNTRYPVTLGGLRKKKKTFLKRRGFIFKDLKKKKKRFRFTAHLERSRHSDVSSPPCSEWCCFYAGPGFAKQEPQEEQEGERLKGPFRRGRWSARFPVDLTRG